MSSKATGATGTTTPRPSEDGVTVGVRIRPLLSRDLAEGARECLHKVFGEPQVLLGADRAFTFNHVFEPSAAQESIFDGCMSGLVESVVKGYNATVFAYGQTGSGKTHTMGTNWAADKGETADLAADGAGLGEDAGLIPRAIADLFGRIAAVEGGADCRCSASFIEIYKEEVHDLIGEPSESGALPSLPIRENPDGGLTLTGQKSRTVANVGEAMSVLAEGARNRATGATAMNATSSRSHAIFTMALELRIGGKTFSPKLHFVDLAGSERAKRTGASGSRLKEGIEINKGLLALGNVINALCERQHHVPYRDSKLTRLLQDSLGGNSKTLMLACVSPGDADLEETLNTLKYANRARQIKNKPIIAQDPMQARISELLEQIATLQARLTHYEGGGAPLPPMAPAAAAAATEGGVAASAALEKKEAAKAEAAKAADAVLMRRCTQLQSENEKLRAKLTTLLKASSAYTGAPAGAPVDAGSAGALAGDAGGEGGEGEAAAAAAAAANTPEEEELEREQMEMELEFLQKQGELTEQLDGLNASLALKQALLAQQPTISAAAVDDLVTTTDCEEGGVADESPTELQERLASLEAKLKGVESERDAFHRQVPRPPMCTCTWMCACEPFHRLPSPGCVPRAALAPPHAPTALSVPRPAPTHAPPADAHCQVAQLRMHSDADGEPTKRASKRLHELEAEISRLRRQHSQQQALLRARQASEQRVSQLESEIDQIKAQKAEIARRQREEAEVHRATRIAREREMIQLRRRGEKTAAQLSKLEEEHAKQGTVLKRKLEEAASTQKRLRAQEELVKQAAAARRPGSAMGSSTASKGFAFGPAAGKAPLPSPRDGPPPSARKLLTSSHAGATATTASMTAKVEGKKAEDLSKAVSAMGAKPKEWLREELTAVVTQQHLREQVSGVEGCRGSLA